MTDILLYVIGRLDTNFGA